MWRGVFRRDRVFASSKLEVGHIYSREDLRRLFDISDATLNTGIFSPGGYNSIWLFVTEKKSADRTQYDDRLEGDTLHWDGQTAGRKDDAIIKHQQMGVELLVFYRKSKAEYPGASFRYEGCFRYVSHTGAQPTHFVLERVISQ